MKPYAAVWPSDDTRQPTQGPRHRPAGDAAADPGVPAAATAARARSRAATPDGKTGCRTAEHGLRFEGTKCSSHPGTVAAEKIRIRRLGAGPRAAACRVGARGVRPGGIGRLGLGRTPPLGAATPVPPALVPAFLLAVGGPPILPAGPPSPPPPGRRAALGATVPGLGMGGSEELLASLEQTPPLSRPTCPLTGSQIGGELGVGPRKRRTSDGQASGAESLRLRPKATSFIPSAPGPARINVVEESGLP